MSTANPGWKEFLMDFNEWGSAHGGVPLPNQTFGFTRAQAQKALGERLSIIAAKRAELDPENRLLNDFFRNLFGVGATASAPGWGDAKEEWLSHPGFCSDAAAGNCSEHKSSSCPRRQADLPRNAPLVTHPPATAGTRPSPGRCAPAGCRRPAPGGSRSCPRSPGTAPAP